MNSTRRVRKVASVYLRDGTVNNVEESRFPSCSFKRTPASSPSFARMIRHLLLVMMGLLATTTIEGAVRDATFLCSLDVAPIPEDQPGGRQRKKTRGSFSFDSMPPLCHL